MGKRALYREYRPTTFSEVIGQDHITTILKNQVREQNFSHAYLFCGSRGTGKTSSAKILSRAVNCLHPKDGEPCKTCEACRIALEGTADIIEIDAASNNGVDNVRELIDQAQFAPLQLKYRVFIIDEVHMLSTAAFNALLKTLEEPPKHVLFILATTEPQKLPATIISRCQRFDFHRLTIAHILARLQTVLKSVGAEIEPDGLRLIARAADGGMRDALSLLDQCLSFCGNKVSKQDVLDTLGSVGQEVLFSMSAAILSNDAAKCLSILNEVVRTGRDLTVFTGDLNAHLSALLLAKTCGDCSDLLDITDDQMDQYRKQANTASQEQILYALEKLVAAQSNLRYFTAPRILLESTLVRVCRPVDEHTVEALEARIAQLEQNGVRVVSKAETPAFSSPEPEEPPIPEAPPEDLPPWEPEPEKPQRAVQTTNPKQPEPKQSPDSKTTADSDPSAINEPDRLWKAVLDRIKRKNPIVFMLAGAGKGVSIKNDLLTVEFPSNAESKMTMLNASMNLSIVNACMNEVKEGMTVVFRSEQLNAGEQKLKSLFGDALTIEDS